MKSKKPNSTKTKSMIAIAVCLFIMVIGLMSGASEEAASVGRALLIPAILLLCLVIWWHRKVKDHQPRGLLTKQNRPPLSKDEISIISSTIAFSAVKHDAAQRAPETHKEDEYSIANAAIVGLVIAMQGDRQTPLSHDELRSVDILYRASFVKDGHLAPLNQEHMAMVADQAPILSMRAKITAYLEAKNQQKREYETWLAQIGNPDASHLLKKGWVNFLKSLPGPDISLWHNVATDFHDLYGDRLKGAFWVALQPECDRLTVWAFVNGVLGYNSVQKEHLPYLSKIIEQWNAGVYRYHSIEYLEDSLHYDYMAGTADVNQMIEALERRTGQNLPRVKNFELDLHNTTDDLSRSVTSAFDFWDDAGLHLRCPNPWPEGTAPPQSP